MMMETSALPPRKSCDFSCTDPMCVTLDHAGVPRDDRWRSLVLYLRSLEHHDYLSAQQKGRFQGLLLDIVRGKNYSDEQFRNLMARSEEIFSAPYVEKIQHAVDESEEMLREFQTVLRKRRGDIKTLEMQSAAATASGKNPLEVLHVLRMAMRDILTVMDEDLNSLDRMSRTDPLTGLANRRAFDQAIEDALKGAGARMPVSLIMLDIDQFKGFNDTYGHRCGDQVLATTAAILRECAAEFQREVPGALLPARFGGEEFVVLASNITAGTATGLAEKIRHRLESHCFRLRHATGAVPQNRISVTASFGVADLSMCEEKTAAELIDLTDKALYLAKAGGRNRVEIARPSGESGMDEAAPLAAG